MSFVERLLEADHYEYGCPVLLVGDHASARVPPGIDLIISDHLLTAHIAVDIGVAELANALADYLPAATFLGAVSRLVIDFNRSEGSSQLVPTESDGHAIPGNLGADIQDRLNRFWRPYHDALASRIASAPPKMIVSLHSFTPTLATSDAPRPWEVGVLYNRDDRAARIAIPLLEADAIVVGDQLPYSGRDLNYTMDRHAEGNNIPYLGLEVRQDLIADADGVTRWVSRLRPIIDAVAGALAGVAR